MARAQDSNAARLVNVFKKASRDSKGPQCTMVALGMDGEVNTLSVFTEALSQANPDDPLYKALADWLLVVKHPASTSAATNSLDCGRIFQTGKGAHRHGTFFDELLDGKQELDPSIMRDLDAGFKAAKLPLSGAYHHVSTITQHLPTILGKMFTFVNITDSFKTPGIVPFSKENIAAQFPCYSKLTAAQEVKLEQELVTVSKVFREKGEVDEDALNVMMQNCGLQRDPDDPRRGDLAARQRHRAELLSHPLMQKKIAVDMKANEKKRAEQLKRQEADDECKKLKSAIDGLAAELKKVIAKHAHSKTVCMCSASSDSDVDMVECSGLSIYCPCMKWMCRHCAEELNWSGEFEEALAAQSFKFFCPFCFHYKELKAAHITVKHDHMEVFDYLGMYDDIKICKEILAGDCPDYIPCDDDDESESGVEEEEQQGEDDDDADDDGNDDNEPHQLRRSTRKVRRV